MFADSEGPAATILTKATQILAPVIGEEFVFVGGQVVEFMVTSPASTAPRPTYDVDLVVPITTRRDYAALEETLRSAGLRHDASEGAPICRWTTEEGMVLDIMPMKEDVLGFANRWYPQVVRHRIYHLLYTGVSAPLPTPPLYLATKWEAFRDRGGADPLRSEDLEDIISVVAGRPEIVSEIQTEAAGLRHWLAAKANALVDEGLLSYAIEGTLTDAVLVPGTVEYVLGRFRAIAALGEGR